jgi:hypothetical protein
MQFCRAPGTAFALTLHASLGRTFEHDAQNNYRRESYRHLLRTDDNLLDQELGHGSTSCWHPTIMLKGRSIIRQTRLLNNVIKDSQDKRQDRPMHWIQVTGGSSDLNNVRYGIATGDILVNDVVFGIEDRGPRSVIIRRVHAQLRVKGVALLSWQKEHFATVDAVRSLVLEKLYDKVAASIAKGLRVLKDTSLQSESLGIDFMRRDILNFMWLDWNDSDIPKQPEEGSSSNTVQRATSTQVTRYL